MFKWPTPSLLSLLSLFLSSIMDICQHPILRHLSWSSSSRPFFLRCRSKQWVCSQRVPNLFPFSFIVCIKVLSPLLIISSFFPMSCTPDFLHSLPCPHFESLQSSYVRFPVVHVSVLYIIQHSISVSLLFISSYFYLVFLSEVVPFLGLPFFLL